MRPPLLARHSFAPDAFDQVSWVSHGIADEINPARVAALGFRHGREKLVAFTPCRSIAGSGINRSIRNIATSMLSRLPT